MAVSDIQLLDAYARVSSQAYLETEPPQTTGPVAGPNGGRYVEIRSGG